LHAALQGAGARILRLDKLGKAMGAALLRMEIEVSAEEFEQAQKTSEGAGGSFERQHHLAGISRNV
jgi:hypothetical protein